MTCEGRPWTPTTPSLIPTEAKLEAFDRLHALALREYERYRAEGPDESGDAWLECWQAVMGLLGPGVFGALHGTEEGSEER